MKKKKMIISEGLDGFPFFVVLCSNIRRIHFSWQGGHILPSSLLVVRVRVTTVLVPPSLLK